VDCLLFDDIGPSDEPINDHRQRSSDQRGRGYVVGGLVAFADQTQWHRCEEEGDNLAADVLGAQSEQRRVIAATMTAASSAPTT